MEIYDKRYEKMKMKLIKLANSNYTLYDSDGDIVASNDPKSV